MGLLDRVTPPVYQKLKPFNLKEVQRLKLTNGRNLFFLDHGDQPIFKLELSIKAGSWYSSKYDLFSLALKMLNESTINKTSAQMANAIDTLGAFIEFNPGFDAASISIYGLTKHFEAITNLIAEVLQNPKFDPTEFKTLKSKELQRIKLNEDKNSYISSIELRKAIFGLGHPYGRSSDINEFESISLREVKDFFSSNFDDYDIFLSGKLPDSFESLLNSHFGQDSIQLVVEQGFNFKQTPNNGSQIARSNSVQSSIKIGKRLFKRNHPEYIEFLITNELLGGYFGSRLMKNIREEKGLTYGIYSQLYSLKHEGYFCISTDAKGDYTQQVIDEIFKEIETLQTVPVSSNELEKVKNYMLGSFSTSIATPFALMDRFKAVHFQGLNYNYYDQYFDILSRITPDQILHQSQKHLQLESLITCSVGPKR